MRLSIHLCKCFDGTGQLTIAESEFSDQYNKPIIVEVGAEREEFHIHRGLVCSYSSYFIGALTHGWKEAEEGKIKLHNENVDVFRVFFEWLYTRRLPVCGLFDTPCSENYSRRLLIQAWIFGDAHGIPSLQNAITSMLIATWDRNSYFVAANNVTLIYENTLSRSPLRKLVVDMAAAWQDRIELLEPENGGEEVYPWEFYRDLAIGAFKTNTNSFKNRNARDWRKYDVR